MSRLPYPEISAFRLLAIGRCRPICDATASSPFRRLLEAVGQGDSSGKVAAESSSQLRSTGAAGRLSSGALSVRQLGVPPQDRADRSRWVAAVVTIAAYAITTASPRPGHLDLGRIRTSSGWIAHARPRCTECLHIKDRAQTPLSRRTRQGSQTAGREQVKFIMACESDQHLTT